MIKNLNETVSLMTSSDFKLRGIAEYYQIKIRTEQNREFIKKWENGELNFTPLNSPEKSKMQFKIGTEQNREFINKWKNGELNFTPLNSLEKSKMQLKAMELYEYTLKERLKQIFDCEDGYDSELENKLEDYVNKHSVFH